MKLSTSHSNKVSFACSEWLTLYSNNSIRCVIELNYFSAWNFSIYLISWHFNSVAKYSIISSFPFWISWNLSSSHWLKHFFIHGKNQFFFVQIICWKRKEMIFRTETSNERQTNSVVYIIVYNSTCECILLVFSGFSLRITYSNVCSDVQIFILNICFVN